MNCQDALDALATGGPLRRWLAARHLAGCPGCAKRADDFRRIVEALADVPPLTEAQRQSWMKAADAEAENVIPIRASTARRLAVAASILGLLALGGWLATRPAVPSPMIVVQTIDPILVKQVTLRDLDGLQAEPRRSRKTSTTSSARLTSSTPAGTSRRCNSSSPASADARPPEPDPSPNPE